MSQSPPPDELAGPLLDRAPCYFMVFHDDGRVEAVNGTLLDLLGYAREEVVGRHVEALLGVGSRIFYQTHLFPLLRLHGRAEEIFLTLQPREGEEIGVLLNVLRHERDGRMVCDCVMMRVRERRKYEEELLRARRVAEEARAQLEEVAVELETANEDLIERSQEAECLRVEAEKANRAKGDFVAVMSHELRTPLNAIAGYVQILDAEIHGPVTDAQRNSLHRIERSQRHLLRLVNDVLNLARIDADAVPVTLRDLPLLEPLHAVLPLIEPQAAERSIALTHEVPADLQVRADSELVEQILVNLLGNAVKFTPPEGAIGLTAVTGQDGGTVHLRVEDTGIGIPADLLPTIFDRFTQVNVSDTRSGEGSGLGLAISRDLARAMGGDLTAESAEGKGSIFTLHLPGVATAE